MATDISKETNDNDVVEVVEDISKEEKKSTMDILKGYCLYECIANRLVCLVS